MSGGGRLAVLAELVEEKEHHSIAVLKEKLETNFFFNKNIFSAYCIGIFVNLI